MSYHTSILASLYLAWQARLFSLPSCEAEGSHEGREKGLACQTSLYHICLLGNSNHYMVSPSLTGIGACRPGPTRAMPG